MRCILSEPRGLRRPIGNTDLSAPSQTIDVGTASKRDISGRHAAPALRLASPPPSIVALVVCVLGSVLGVAPSAIAQPDVAADSFRAANDAYTQGRYEDAVTTYRQILKTGTGGLALYHNLGNAYVRLDSVGAAVWAYEKALQFDPADRRVQHNLEFVRLREGLPIGGLPPRGVVGLVAGWPTSLLFGLGVLLLTGGGIAGVLWAGEEELGRWRVPGAWGPIAGGFLLVIVALGASYAQSQDRRAVVTGKGVGLRATAGATTAPDTTVSEGTMVEVEAREAPWVQIRLGDGTVGWTRRGNVWGL